MVVPAYRKTLRIRRKQLKTTRKQRGLLTTSRKFLHKGILYMQVKGRLLLYLLPTATMATVAGGSGGRRKTTQNSRKLRMV